MVLQTIKDESVAALSLEDEVTTVGLDVTLRAMRAGVENSGKFNLYASSQSGKLSSAPMR